MTRASYQLVDPPPMTPVDGMAAGAAATTGIVTSRVVDALGRRKMALGIASAVIIFGNAYYFFFGPLFRQSNTWTAPGDLWGMFRGAHYVAWGYLGGIYNQETGMVTFPGIAVVLAPIAFLTDTFHLSSSIAGFQLPHPTAALLLIPAVMVLASTVVVAADDLASELGATAFRRRFLGVLVGSMAWGATIVWGHPEDALVMTFACYAMVSVLRSNWRRAAWLFGVGIALQPLLVLAIPVFIAISPSGQRAVFAFRSSALATFLVGVAFIGNPHGAYRALVEQPTPPFFNHATPWVSWAPHVALSGPGSAFGAGLRRTPGTGTYSTLTVPNHTLLQVAAGPGRTIYLMFALGAGLFAWRRPQDPVRLLWLAGVVLAARCNFEAVMTPYYLTPPLILLLVLAAHRGTWRFSASATAAVATSWFAYWHLAPWVWWLPIIAGMTVVMVLSFPIVERMPGDTVTFGASRENELEIVPDESLPVDLLPA